MSVSRRLQQFKLVIVGRHPFDYAQELQELLKDLWNQSLGIPGGWKNTTPPVIIAGSTGTAGTEQSGWQAADARPGISTATPSQPTGVTASEGSGPALMRADATIQDIILVTAAGQPNNYSLVSDSSVALGISWIPALTREEVLAVRELTTGSGIGERGSRAGSTPSCDGRFASDRRSPCGPDTCCTLSSERGTRR